MSPSSPSGLEESAAKALGHLSPQAAWSQVVDKVSQALELDPEKSQQLAEKMHLFDQPDDPLELHDLSDLLEVITGMNPIRGINHLQYISDLNLQQLEQQPALKVLGEVLKIFTQSDRWAAQMSGD